MSPSLTLIWLKCYVYMKDVGVCYAFVEFEDMTGVHNAVNVWLLSMVSFALFFLFFSCENDVHVPKLTTLGL